jgi:hypothetical protein
MASLGSRTIKIGKKIRNRFILRNSNYVFSNFENYDNISIYPCHGLIYNRIKKSGNTTITAFLNDVLVGKRHENAERLKADLIRPLDLSPGELRSLLTYRTITFVRNPYDRVLSAYLGSGRIQKSYGDFRFGTNSKEHFHQFLEFLDNGGLYLDRHWWPQVDLLFQPVEKFTYIGKLESIVADMKVILQLIGVDSESASLLDQPHEIEIHDGAGKIRSARLKTQYYYSDRGRAIVERLYCKDFEKFNYKPAD